MQQGERDWLTQGSHEPEESNAHLMQQEQVRHKDEEPAWAQQQLIDIQSANSQQD
jgi:hypothetical protein